MKTAMVTGALGAAMLAMMLGGCTGIVTGGGKSGAADAGDGGPNDDGCGGGGCVDVPLSKYDTSCNVDSDCVTVTTGHVCPGDCLCGGSAINVSSEATWQSDVSGVAVGECGCPAEPVPTCVAHQCTVGAADDGGTLGVDASPPLCVNIPPSTYTTSCQLDSDCTLLPEGQICAGSCDCGGSPVNVSGEAAFQQLTAGITLGECPCYQPGPVACVAGTCTQCGYGSDGGISCGDGG